MPTFFERISSYLTPSLVEKCEGDITKNIRVVFSDGKYHLNARGINYSGGGCYEVFENVFRKKHFEKYDFKSVLILGLGGGDVTSLICEKYKKTPRIVGVEWDRAVLELGDKYFSMNRFPTLEKVHSDAIKFLEECSETFDLVVVDIFVDNAVPPEFHTERFAKLVKKVAKEKSVTVFNKMIYEKAVIQEVAELAQIFDTVFPQVEVIKTSSHGVETNMLWCDTFKK